jgi:transcription termination factor Rho
MREDPGVLGLNEGRNPLSDTTDVTSGVSDVADDGASASGTAKRRRSGAGLSAKLLPELQSLAASLGISGTARMRKGELITAISERQGGGAATGGASRPRTTNGADAPAAAAPVVAAAPVAAAAKEKAPVAQRAAKAEPVAKAQAEPAPASAQQAPAQQAPAQQAPAQQAPAAHAPAVQAQATQVPAAQNTGPTGPQTAEIKPFTVTQEAVDNESKRGNAAASGEQATERTNERGDRPERGESRNGRDRGDRQRGQRTGTESADRPERTDRGDRPDRADRPDRGDRGPRTEQQPNASTDDNDGDDSEGGRRSRRSRFRDRRRGRGDRDGVEAGTAPREGGGGRESSGRDTGREGGRDGGRDQQPNEDDVLVPVAGILDVLDNYAFVRTTGYLAGPNDVYVSMSQVKKHGLRRGDAVTGAVRAVRGDSEGRRDKYNPLVRLDTINGMEPEEARRRPEFYKLTPLYPQERLRLETEPHILTTRVIDLVMPLGKGQRALIVSPPKAGKTMVLQAIANAITHNNPECHLMVVLVDERPEEVTDMQRSVKGEVIAATFDRPPQDHTTVAELAIERAKRLVELGHDVVVLLDSVTRLGRSYNLAAPASGRIMSGGIDSTALYPPKRFLGAARNIENGGSLTILATALVETGSMMDTVIFEEFKGTGNAELKLDRKIADKRTFPAIDIHPSGTRKEEILLGKDELAIIHKLRKVLHSLDSAAALDLLLDRLKQSRTNIEFLMQIAKSTPGE